MRFILVLLALISFPTEHAVAAGSEAIIKQRAKELSNQKKALARLEEWVGVPLS